jgi:hypothetical protein
MTEKKSVLNAMEKALLTRALRMKGAARRATVLAWSPMMAKGPKRYGTHIPSGGRERHRRAAVSIRRHARSFRFFFDSRKRCSIPSAARS